MSSDLFLDDFECVLILNTWNQIHRSLVYHKVELFPPGGARTRMQLRGPSLSISSVKREKKGLSHDYFKEMSLNTYH